MTVRVEHVAHEGEQAFGLPEGFTFYYLGPVQIDCQGNMLFVGGLSGPDVTPDNDWAIFYGQPGNITKLISESGPAPCMPEGVVVSSLYYAGEHLSETAPGSILDDSPGWIALTVNISGPGITPYVNDRVFYVGPPDDLQPVLQGGDQAPGCEPGVYIDVSSDVGFGGFLSDHATPVRMCRPGGPGRNDAERPGVLDRHARESATRCQNRDAGSWMRHGRDLLRGRSCRSQRHRPARFPRHTKGLGRYECERQQSLALGPPDRAHQGRTRRRSRNLVRRRSNRGRRSAGRSVTSTVRVKLVSRAISKARALPQPMIASWSWGCRPTFKS